MTKGIKTVFVAGPTASGKTALGIGIAKALGGEVVSADSMQIYKGIHIASAAPDEQEKEGIPHHLLEFTDTDYQFSVADYVKKARECIKDINSRGILPIVVGGTGLYISSLADNTYYSEEKTDLRLRSELEEQFDTLGGEEMLKRLRDIDAQSADLLHPNDRRRIIRAFEVYESSGITKTQHNFLSHKGEEIVEPLIIGITYENRELLYQRINKRVDIMLENGLLAEAEQSYKRNTAKGGFQAIGHKELYPYFEGAVSLDEAVERLKMQTRRYAKRQLTWFRRDERINWIYADKSESPIKDALNIINDFWK